MKLRPFQRAFIRGATAPEIDTAALSTPLGQGKSWLAAHLLARVLTPGDALFRPGTESVLCAGTLEQARIVFRFLRSSLEDRGGFAFTDSANPDLVLARRDPYTVESDRLQRSGRVRAGRLPVGGRRRARRVGDARR